MEKTIKYLENGEYHYATVKDVGDLAKLKTDSKDDLVTAINELFITGGEGPKKPDGYDELVDNVADAIQKQQQMTDTITNMQQSAQLSDAEMQHMKQVQEEAHQDYIKALKEFNDAIAQANADALELDKKTDELKKNADDLNEKTNDLQDKLNETFTNVGNEVSAVHKQLDTESAGLHKELNDTKTSLEATRKDLLNNTQEFGVVNSEVKELKDKMDRRIWSTDLDPVREQVNKNTTEVSQTKDELKNKADQSNLDLVTNSVENLSTQVKENADGLKVSVKKDELGGDVAKLLNDKTNLLLGTRNFSGDSWGNKTFWHEEAGYWKGLKVFSSTEIWFGLQYKYEVKQGQQYTFSFWARQEKDNSSASIVLSESDKGDQGITTPYTRGVHIGTEWKRYSLTFQAESDGIIYPRVEQNVQGNKLYIAGYKLELGSVATPWEPNEADVAENIEHNESQFNVYSDQIAGIVKKQEKIGDTERQLDTRITETAEGLKQTSKDLQDANGKITEFKGQLESTARGLKTEYEKYTNDAIGQISDSSLNLIRNSAFQNKDDNFAQWQNVSAKANIREDGNGLRWVELTQSGMTTDNPQGITSNYFVIKQGKVTVAVDIKLGDKANLDNQNILLLELYNDNKQRVDFTDVSVSQLGLSTAILNDHNVHRGLYRLGIDREDVKYMTVKTILHRNGDLWFTNFSARLSSIDDGGYTPNPDDVNQQILKMNTQIEEDAEHIALKANSVDVTRDIKSAVDGVQVGGTNLLRGTSSEAISGDAPTTGWKDMGSIYNTSGPLNEKQYVLSFDARGDVDKQIIQTFLWAESLGGHNIVTSSVTSQGDKYYSEDGNSYFTLTTQWTRYWVIYNVSPDNTRKQVIVGRRQAQASGKTASGKVYIKSVKLEEGNKSTSWSPAPEDTSAEIKSAKDAAIQVASDQINIHVNEISTSFDDKLNKRVNEVKTASEKFTSDGIEQTVRKITDVKGQVDDVNDRVNNLKVGGRNLVRNTGSDIVIDAMSANAGNWTFTRLYFTEQPKQGDLITVSAEGTLTGTGTLDKYRVILFDMDNSTPRSQAQYLKAGKRDSVTLSLDNLDGVGDTILLIYAGEAGETKGKKNVIHHLKVEFGNVATDWSPAPEDVDSKFQYKEVTGAIDFNDLKTQQKIFYRDTQAKNSPAGGSYWYFVDVKPISDRIVQVATSDRNNITWMRTLADTWTPWQRQATQGDVDNVNGQINTANGKISTLQLATQWHTVSGPLDLNDLKTQQRIFYQDTQEKNSAVSGWQYITVDTADNSRITQTVWKDNVAMQYTRQYINSSWTQWTRNANQADIDKASNGLRQEIKSAKDAAIDVASDKIEIKVNELKTTYEETLNTKINEVKTASEKFTSDGIEQTVSKITEVQSNVDNLNEKVDSNNGGGINLQKGTKDFSFQIGTNGNPSSIETYNSDTKMLHTQNGGFYTSYSDSSFVPTPGEFYTLSADVKGDGTINGSGFRYEGGNNGTMGNITLSDTWQRIINTVHVDKVQGQWVIYPTNSKNLYVKHIKIERGTVATPWTAAPEDVQTQIDANKTAANNAQNTANTANSMAGNAVTNASSAVSIANNANTTANQAKSNANSAVNTANNANNNANQANTNASSAVNTANNAKSTADNANNSANSAVNTANQANGNASQAVTTANSANSKVTAIQANGGGRNLLQGTRDFKNFGYLSKVAVTNGQETFQAVTGTQSSSATYYDIVYFSNVPLEKDTDYTASFWIKTSENVDITSYLFDSGSNGNYSDSRKVNQSTTDYKRIVVHFHNGNNTATPSFIPARINKAGVTIWVYGCMLEKGTIAHDWSPAPEDVNQGIKDATEYKVVTGTLDFNDLKTKQKIFYRDVHAANTPAGTAYWYYLDVEPGDSNSRIIQTAVSDRDNITWKRTWADSWGPWVKQSDQKDVDALNGKINSLKTETTASVKNLGDRVTTEVNSITSKVNSNNGGGVNLLLNTQSFDQNWTWDSIGHSFANGILTLSDTNNGNSRMYQGIAGKSPAGRTFALSFNARISDDCNSEKVGVRVGPYDAGKSIDVTGKSFQSYKLEGWQWTGTSTTFSFYVIGGKIDISNLKLEYGYVATPWSQAPEDVNEAIKSVNTKLDVANGQIQGKVTETQVQDLLNRGHYATQEWSQGQINLTKDQFNVDIKKVTDDLNTRVNEVKTASEKFTSDGIEQTVKKITDVKNQVDGVNSKVNNLQIGGRNIARNTDRDIVIDDTGNTGAQGWKFVSIPLTQQPKVGDQITVSAEGTLTGKGNLGTYDVILYNSTTSNARSNSKRLSSGKRASATLQVNNLDGNGDTVLLIYAGNISDTEGKKNTVHHLKVEFGNVATDWTPAPEDINQKIDTQTFDVANIDNLKTQGHYFVKSLTGNPLGSGWVYVDVMGNNNDRIRQDVYQDNGNKHMYRRLFGTAWSPWEQGAYLSDVNNVRTEVTASVKNLGDRVTTEVNSITSKINSNNGGGINLVKKSSFHNIILSQLSPTWAISPRVSIDNGTIKNGAIKIDSQGSSSLSEIQQPISVDPDTDYTFSMHLIWGKADKNFHAHIFMVEYGDDGKTISPYADHSHDIANNAARSANTYTIHTSKNTHSIRLYIRAEAGSMIELEEVKLERGSIATPWSPSPADTDAAIESINTKLDVANGQIQGKVTATDVNNILNGKGYATQSWAQTMFTMKSDAITLQAVRDNITNGIQNQINDTRNQVKGLQNQFNTQTGINLLKGTADFSGPWFNKDANGWSIMSGWQAPFSENTSAMNNNVVYVKSGSAWNGLGQAVQLNPGEYTFSMWLWPDLSGKESLSIYAGDGQYGGTATLSCGYTYSASQPQKQWVLAKLYLNVTKGGVVAIRPELNQDTGKMYVASYMLQRGHVENPTWAPNPGDLSPSNIVSAINLTPDDIKLASKKINIDGNTSISGTLNVPTVRLQGKSGQIDLSGDSGISIKDSSDGKVDIGASGVNIFSGMQTVNTDFADKSGFKLNVGSSGVEFSNVLHQTNGIMGAGQHEYGFLKIEPAVLPGTNTQETQYNAPAGIIGYVENMPDASLGPMSPGGFLALGSRTRKDTNVNSPVEDKTEIVYANKALNGWDQGLTIRSQFFIKPQDADHGIRSAWVSWSAWDHGEKYPAFVNDSGAWGGICFPRSGRVTLFDSGGQYYTPDRSTGVGPYDNYWTKGQ